MGNFEGKQVVGVNIFFVGKKVSRVDFVGVKVGSFVDRAGVFVGGLEGLIEGKMAMFCV